MSFPSQADYELLIYNLPQTHPDIVSSSLHLYTTSSGTAIVRGNVRLRNHAHPNIKRNRYPAIGISFTAPNLPILITELSRLRPADSPTR